MDISLDTQDITDADKRIKYFSGQRFGKRRHFGQLKLAVSFLDLMNFMVLRHKGDANSKIYVAYVGAAPGQYLGLMTMLFTGLEIEAWDPNALRPGKRRTKESILFHKKLFVDTDTEYLAEKIKEKRKQGYITAFVSDIRKKVKTKTPESRAETEYEIKADMELQKQWAIAVQADWTQLKFRPPYSYIKGMPSYDEKTIEYFGGRSVRIVKQVFPPGLSTETRLYVPRKSLGKMRKFDTVKYEEQMFNHNIRVREHVFGPDHPKFKTLNSTPEFDRKTKHNSFDKYWTLRTIADYTRKIRGMKWNAAETVAEEKRILNRVLRAV